MNYLWIIGGSTCFSLILIKDFASKAKENFPELVTEVELIHDFEMVPGLRRPKVLVQTAAHVAGEYLKG